LDLNGHSLKGQTFTPEDTYGVLVEGGGHVARVKIINGTIDGFGAGIGVFNARDVTISDITITNFANDNPNYSIVGISYFMSDNIVVEDSRFYFHHNVAHRNAVVGGDGNVSVRNITSSGGMVAIGFCNSLSIPHYAEVLDSNFSNVAIGVWIPCTNNTLIAGNIFTDCNNAVQGDAPFAGAIKGLRVENNVATTSVSPALGIQFRGVTQSTVLNNTVTGHDAWGITIGRSLGCIDPINNPGWDCFYSTDNLIGGNVALDNGTDLFHDAGSTPNSWQNNTCFTTEGADITPCDCPEWVCGGSRGWRLKLLLPQSDKSVQ